MYDSSKSPTLIRPVASRHTKSFLHLIYEGITEKGYISGIVRNRMVNPDFYIKNVPKEGLDKDVSDRKEMVLLVRDYELYLSTGRNTLRRYVTAILNQYLEGCNEEYCYLNDVTYNDFVDELCSFRSDLLIKFSNDSAFVSDGFVIPSSGLFEAISLECIDRFGVEYTFCHEDNLFENDAVNGKNSFFVMFDRDYHPEYRTHEMYKECISLCADFGYKPLVSSPQFELWMLMHMNGVNYGKPSYDKYKYELLRLLQEFDPYSRSKREKFMTPERFQDYYKDGVAHAIEVSKSDIFVSDPLLLMDHAGTNLGLFFESILKQEYGGH